MSWRLARSLGQLQRDLDARFPGRVTPDWTIGDAAHAGRGSDHNPNLAGVVCAIDVRGESTARALWDHILRTKPARVKYVIFQRRIVSSTVSPWTVRPYGGSNPHNDHIHVSVGRGSDGNSGRPDLYDSTAPWWGSPSPAPTKDWFDMADRDDLRAVVREEVRDLPNLEQIAIKIVETLSPDHKGYQVRVGDLDGHAQRQLDLVIRAAVQRSVADGGEARDELEQLVESVVRRVLAEREG